MGVYILMSGNLPKLYYEGETESVIICVGEDGYNLFRGNLGIFRGNFVVRVGEFGRFGR